jgi:hypothetical protein
MNEETRGHNFGVQSDVCYPIFEAENETQFREEES